LESFDYIIAGAGAAGLSLAYRIARSPLQPKKVLLLDVDPKESNDRTWCFWSEQPMLFDDIVCKEWADLGFWEEGRRSGGDISPATYKMIRGLDFYRKVKSALAKQPAFEWREEQVVRYEEHGSGACVVTNQGEYWAPVVFNSCLLPPSPSKKEETHFLWQHFTGWWIKTEEDYFNPDKGVLMDFRTPQYGSARFFYLLPLNKREALVEYTIFSPERLEAHHYRDALRQYLQGQWGLDSYHLQEEEGGAIPMTDRKMPAYWSPHVLNIGTMGGAVKPTTGYAFLNIQRQTRQLVAQMEAGAKLNPALHTPARFRFYDRLLLNILQYFGEEGKNIFCRLFRYNRIRRILRFLEEGTHIGQEARLFATLPIVTFLRAVYRIYLVGGLRRVIKKLYSGKEKHPASPAVLGYSRRITAFTKREKRKAL